MTPALGIWLACFGLLAAAAPPRIASRATGELPRLVFVSRQPATLDPDQIPGLGPRGRVLASGGTLLVRERDGRVRALVAPSAFFDVADPCVSWDAKRIVFAGTTSPDSAWRIWVVNADGTALAPVTHTDRHANLAAAGFDPARWDRYDDLDPCWLPEGRICFASTRWPQRAEFDDVPVTNLFVVGVEHGAPQRITAERNGADEPGIDPATGRVVYTRWWFNRFLPSDLDTHGITLDRARAVPQDTINLWTAGSVTPDGDGIKLAGGDARVRRSLMAYQPVMLRDGTLVGVWAENMALTPVPGKLGVRAFPHAFAPPHALAGLGSDLGGSACGPAALPDGRLLFSWAPPGSNDYGIYAMRPDGTRVERVLDLPGTLELDAAALARRPRPPVVPEQFPNPPAALPNVRAEQAKDVGTTTFRFDCLNVFTNAAVDAAIPDAPPPGRGLRIRFFSVVARPAAAGGDSLVLLREVPIDPSGAIHIDDILADSPGFEQLVDAQGRVVRSARGPAHVAGFNFARLGAGTKCVGCHTGHSTIPVPTNNWRAKWFNASPSAEVWASSQGAGSARGAVDRRTQGPPDRVAWVAQGIRGERIRLSWQMPLEVRAVVLYSVQSEPSEGTIQRIRETEIAFFRGNDVVKHLTVRRDLSSKGTRIDCDPIVADAIEIAPTRVTGLVQHRSATALAEIETIARLLEQN